MRKIFLISLLVVSSALLSACAGAATSTQASTKPIDVKVESNPNPVTTGDAELMFTITDANGNPLEGATVDVSADHTGHSGMSMSGVATEQGDGKYAINANFNMSGNWKMTVYVRKEGLDYKEDIELEVQ